MFIFCSGEKKFKSPNAKKEFVCKLDFQLLILQMVRFLGYFRLQSHAIVLRRPEPFETKSLDVGNNFFRCCLVNA